MLICEGDADTQIVGEAIGLACNKENVTVFAEDTDILILLLYFWNSKMAKIFMTSEAKKNKKEKLVNAWKIMADLSPLVAKNMLFIQAWSDCDITSRRFNQGKTAVMNMFDNKNSKVLMTSEAKKNKKRKLVYLWKIMANVSPLVVKNLLFIHAWSGCDTMSGIFNQGKIMVMNMVDNKNSKVLEVCEVFNSMEVTPEAVTEDVYSFLW